ncbi:MAG: TRM11 family SAM-dependent methyltransferase [Armatimonadota bacterium]
MISLSGNGYVYTVNCLDPDADLAAAEAWAFTGCEMQGRVVYAPHAVDIARSAYLLHCVSIEAQGGSMDELIEDCLRQDIRYEGFHLKLLRPPPRVDARTDKVIIPLANAITGQPDLTAPKVRLAVVVVRESVPLEGPATCRPAVGRSNPSPTAEPLTQQTAGRQVAGPSVQPAPLSERWMLGRIISHGENRWLEGMVRPIHFSSALPQRFSRALVNLVAAPGDTLLDPCCGIGTPLMEAMEAGVIAFGADTNPKMLRGLAENLRHLGLPLRLFRADARQLVGHYDAAVLDFPYGRNLQLDENLCRDILTPLKQAVRRAAIVSAQRLDDLLTEVGFRTVRYLSVHKGQMVRHVYVVVPEQ